MVLSTVRYIEDCLYFIITICPSSTIQMKIKQRNNKNIFVSSVYNRNLLFLKQLNKWQLKAFDIIIITIIRIYNYNNKYSRHTETQFFVIN